jgi:hypothetical protein
LSLNARTSIEEQGVNILYVAFGLLQWYEAPHSDEVILAPLLLLPVCLNRPGVGELWTLQPYENEIVENQCLKEMLRSSFRLELPAYSVSDDEDMAPDPFEYFKRIRKFLASVRPEIAWEHFFASKSPLVSLEESESESPRRVVDAANRMRVVHCSASRAPRRIP